MFRPGVVLVLSVLLPFAAFAGTGQEQYENDLINATLHELGLEPEPRPEGKTIERVIVSRHPIIEQTDPWPGWLNVFHITTREHVVRRELLFAEGQRYSEELVRESARNLRALPLVFSVVRIVAAKGSRPDAVVVVVITKDLWSLRLNSQFNIGGGTFNYLSLMPTEQNFLGLAQRLSLYTYIDRDTYSVGQIYTIPRLFGSRLAAQESLHLRINHHRQEPEGGFGSVALWYPLYSLRTPWGFSAGASFDIGTVRTYAGGSLRQFCPEPAGDSRACIDWLWDKRAFSTWLEAVRSWGVTNKLNLLFGYRINVLDYNLPPVAESLPPWLVNRFESEVMPQDEFASELYLAVQFFTARYVRLHNVQTYGLTEDFRLGPSFAVEIEGAHPALGPGLERKSLRVGISAGWTFAPLAEDLLSLGVSASARWWPGHSLDQAVEQGTSWVDRYLHLYAENVSPPLFGLGRLFVRFFYGYSRYSTTGFRFSLGGDNTLRGFVSGFTNGERLFNVNVEFRSLPVVLWTLHWGLAVFYDGGDAYGFAPDDDFGYHQSVGIGLRALFPQFDVESLRLDIGIPLGRDFSTSVIDWITFSFRQAF